MSYKSLLVTLLSFTFVGCQTPVSSIGSSKMNNTIQYNTAAVNTAAATRPPVFHIKTTPSTNLQKTILTPQRFVRQTGAPVTQTIPFTVDSADLGRKFLLNVISGPNGTTRLSSGWLSINGVQVIGPDAFNQQVTGTSVALTNLQAGQNELQVRLASGPGATIDVSVEGFADPADIEGAVHSDIPHALIGADVPMRPGIVGIKFREGMRVRLQDDTSALVDLNGISLTPLEKLMAALNVQGVYRSFPFTPEEMDQDEIAAQEMLQSEVPNGNLFYRLEFEATADIWAIVQQIRALPFIEAAYPEFEMQGANHPLSEPYDYSTEPDSNDLTSMFWWPPGQNIAWVPGSALTHSSAQEEFDTPVGIKRAPFAKEAYPYQQGYVGRFFAKQNVPVGWPSVVIPPRMPFMTKIYSTQSPVPGNTIAGSIYFPVGTPYTDSDPFQIGQADNFSASFTGFIRPNVTETYELTVCHDDGIVFFIEENVSGTSWKQINSPSPTARRCDTVTGVQLRAGENHRYVLRYDEGAGGAVLELRWRRTEQAQEVVPASVMFH